MLRHSRTPDRGGVELVSIGSSKEEYSSLYLRISLMSYSNAYKNDITHTLHANRKTPLMMRCKIDSSLICGEQMKTGKALWSVLHDCRNCVVFLKQNQMELSENMSAKEMKEYVKTQKEKLAKQREKAMADKGYKEFYSFEEGETSFYLCPVVPRDKQGNFGDQAVFRIKIDGIEKDFSVNKRSPIFRTLINELETLDNPRLLRMIRDGTGQKTRMSILQPKTKKAKKGKQ